MISDDEEKTWQRRSVIWENKMSKGWTEGKTGGPMRSMYRLLLPIPAGQGAVLYMQTLFS